MSILAALVTQHFATAPDSSHIRLGHCTALEFTHSLCKTGLKSSVSHLYAGPQLLTTTRGNQSDVGLQPRLQTNVVSVLPSVTTSGCWGTWGRTRGEESGGGLGGRTQEEEWKSSPEKSRKHDLVAAAERGTSLNPSLGLTSGPGGAALSPAGIKVEQPKRSHYLILALVQEARHYIMQPG